MSNQKLALAQKLFDAGFKESGRFLSTWKKAKGHVSDAGWYFIKAKEACPDGDWLLLLQTNAEKIAPRTVQFYMQLTDACIGWVKEGKPGIKADKLQDACREVMMLSPKPLVALLRQLREMRPFGEYDAIAYRANKQLANQVAQLELDFTKVIASFDALDHLGESNFSFLLPGGVNEEQALTELKTRLEHALVKINANLDDRTRPLLDA